MVLMVWHVQRRQTALATSPAAAAGARAGRADRERLSRITSHEMRTPLTIALGLRRPAAGREPDPARREDLAVVRDELGRLTRVTERLVRMMRICRTEADSSTSTWTCCCARPRDRWAPVADRSGGVRRGCCAASVERLRACLDTLSRTPFATPTGGT